MKTRNYLILVGVLIINVVLLYLLSGTRVPAPVGSVDEGSAYSAKVLTSANASSTNTTLIKTGAGTFGSLVIASTSGAFTGSFTVYDWDQATSTASTSIALFPSTSANGTYTYDVAVVKGLVVDVPASFNGVYTVTWR